MKTNNIKPRKRELTEADYKYLREFESFYRKKDNKIRELVKFNEEVQAQISDINQDNNNLDIKKAFDLHSREISSLPQNSDMRQYEAHLDTICENIIKQRVIRLDELSTKIQRKISDIKKEHVRSTYVSKSGIKLGQWLNHLRYQYKNGLLHEDSPIIRAVRSKLPLDYFKNLHPKWMHNLKRFRDYAQSKKYRQISSPDYVLKDSEDNDLFVDIKSIEKTFSVWISRQRSMVEKYKQYSRHLLDNLKDLNEETIQQYEEFTTKWRDRYNELNSKENELILESIHRKKYLDSQGDSQSDSERVLEDDNRKKIDQWS